jgi:hypothetical protein
VRVAKCPKVDQHEEGKRNCLSNVAGPDQSKSVYDKEASDNGDLCTIALASVRWWFWPLVGTA